MERDCWAPTCGRPAINMLGWGYTSGDDGFAYVRDTGLVACGHHADLPEWQFLPVWHMRLAVETPVTAETSEVETPEVQRCPHDRLVRSSDPDDEGLWICPECGADFE